MSNKMCKENLNCLLTEKCTNEESIRADERAKAIEEVIKTLAKSEDTMLSDKQYYTLLELKEQKNGRRL